MNLRCGVENDTQGLLTKGLMMDAINSMETQQNRGMAPGCGFKSRMAHLAGARPASAKDMPSQEARQAHKAEPMPLVGQGQVRGRHQRLLAQVWGEPVPPNLRKKRHTVNRVGGSNGVQGIRRQAGSFLDDAEISRVAISGEYTGLDDSRAYADGPKKGNSAPI